MTPERDRGMSRSDVTRTWMTYADIRGVAENGGITVSQHAEFNFNVARILRYANVGRLVGAFFFRVFLWFIDGFFRVHEIRLLIVRGNLRLQLVLYNFRCLVYSTASTTFNNNS